MTAMLFITELLDKLAWPLVVVFGIITLRNPLLNMLPLAKKLKYKDFEVEFVQEMKAVSKKAVGAFPEMKKDKKALLLASVENLPNAAILEAWSVVDDAAEALLISRKSDINLNIDKRYKLIGDTLINGRIIDTKKGKVFNELRILRNKVAHAVGYEVGKAEAMQYIELCFKLVEYLNALTHTKPE